MNTHIAQKYVKGKKFVKGTPVYVEGVVANDFQSQGLGVFVECGDIQGRVTEVPPEKVIEKNKLKAVPVESMREVVKDMEKIWEIMSHNNFVSPDNRGAGDTLIMHIAEKCNKCEIARLISKLKSFNIL